MERIENTDKKASWLKKLWTSLALIWALLTQNPQEANAQQHNATVNNSEIVNDSTIHWDFTPELIESLWSWVNKNFVINPDYVKKDDEKEDKSETEDKEDSSEDSSDSEDKDDEDDDKDKEKAKKYELIEN